MLTLHQRTLSRQLLLGVVLRTGYALRDARMQLIARELRHSETAFC